MGIIFISQEGAGEDIPIMLLGNKTDVDAQREIPLGTGEKLAKVGESGPWRGTNGLPLKHRAVQTNQY